MIVGQRTRFENNIKAISQDRFTYQRFKIIFFVIITCINKNFVQWFCKNCKKSSLVDLNASFSFNYTGERVRQKRKKAGASRIGVTQFRHPGMTTGNSLYNYLQKIIQDSIPSCRWRIRFKIDRTVTEELWNSKSLLPLSTGARSFLSAVSYRQTGMSTTRDSVTGNDDSPAVSFA